MIVASFKCFVSKKDHFIVVLQEAQTICFIPSNGENVKTNLSSNGIFESQIWELSFQLLNEMISYLVLMVILLKSVSLFLRAVSADGRYVDESSPILNEGASFNWDWEISNIVKAEVNELLKLFFS